MENFIISTWGTSNAEAPAIEAFTRRDQYLEYNGIDMQGGLIGTFWADNSHTPAPERILNLAFSRLDLLSTKNVQKPKVRQKVAPEYLLFRPTEYQAESTLSISPVNNQNIAALGLSLPIPIPDFPINVGNLYAVSHDGGKTFDTSIIGLGEDTGIPGMFGADAQIQWDRFNNLWITYLHGDPDNLFPTSAITIGSPNGDPNKFRVVDQLVCTDPRAIAAGGFFDFPWMRVGPDNNPTGAVDGGRPEAVWATGSQFLSSANTLASGAALIIHGFQVFGPLPDDVNAPLTGIVGPVKQFLPPASIVGGYGDIAIGVNGDVLIGAQSTEDNSLFDSANSRTILFTLYNPKGLNGDFGNRQNVGYLDQGWFEKVGPQANRGIAPEFRLVADRSNSRYRDRIYGLVTDKKSPTPGEGLDALTPSNGQAILLTWTDNKGTTWADPIQVNNDPENNNSHFNGALGLDQSTGNLITAWIDARCDPGQNKGCDTDGVPNTDVNWVGAVVTTDFIRSIEKQRAKGQAHCSKKKCQNKKRHSSKNWF